MKFALKKMWTIRPAPQTPVKLNYVLCVLKCREARIALPAVSVDGEEELREPLDRCEELLQVTIYIYIYTCIYLYI